MQNDIPEFIVDWVVRGDSGQLTVLGRCCYVSLSVGEVFDSIARLRRLGAVDRPTADWQKIAPVRIDVIGAYGRSFSVLGHGMTAAMVISGPGADQIEPMTILAFRKRPAPTEQRPVITQDEVIIFGPDTTLESDFIASDGDFTLRLEKEAAGYRVTDPADPGYIDHATTLERAFSQARQRTTATPARGVEPIAAG